MPSFRIQIIRPPNNPGGVFQQLGRFAAQSGAILSDTLTFVEAGGDDLLVLVNILNPFFIDPTKVAQIASEIPGTIQQAISNLNFVLNTVKSLGAEKTIIWNLGDLSQLPLFTDIFSGSATLSQIYSDASVSFNAALVNLVKGLNNNSSKKNQIFIFDAFSAFEEVLATLTAQGVNITQHTITTFGGTVITTGPQPEMLAFYDEIHPTTYAWSYFANIMSAYLDTLIDGPRFIGALQDLAFESTNAFRNIIDNHYRVLHMQHYVYGRDWNNCSCEAERFQFYLDGEAKWGRTHTRHGTLGMKYDTQLILLGMDYHISNCWTLGASFAAQRSFGRVDPARGNIRLNDYVPTVYSSIYGPNYFIDSNLSYHAYDFRKINRRIPFIHDKATSKTQGSGIEFNVEGGYVFQKDCMTVLPIVGLDYEHLYIRRFREKGAGSLNLQIPRQYQDSLIGKLGFQVFLNSFDCGILPFVDIAYEYQFLRCGDSLSTRLFNSLDNAINYNRLGSPARSALKFAVGVDAIITSCMSANFYYEGETTFRYYNNAVKLEIDMNF